MKPLSRKLRRTTFWVMMVIFILGTPVLIGYSKGYRLNDALVLVQTGGVYLNSDISRATVYIDGDFVENNGAFLKNTLIQDLSPTRVYEIWVTKEGLQSWTKKLPVRAKFVTESYVLMLPEEFVWQTVEATTTLALPETGVKSTTTKVVDNPEYIDLETFFLSDKDQYAVEVATTTYTFVRGKRVATTTTVTEFQFPEWLMDIASSSVLSEKTMVREREGILAWIEGGNVVAIWARTEDPIPYYFCIETCKDSLVIDWSEDITRFEFYPNRNDVVVVGTERGIYAVELDSRSQRNIQPILEAPGLDFRFENDGTLTLFDGKVFKVTTW
jgi:hypothetical protein